jgi:hypothetical protein
LPPLIDQIDESAHDLRPVIGNVGCKVGVAPVRLQKRPVDIVAETGRAKKRLLAVFPILEVAAFGRWKPAFIDLSAFAQVFDRGTHFVAFAFDQ